MAVNSLAGYVQVCLVWGTGRSSTPQYHVKTFPFLLLIKRQINFSAISGNRKHTHWTITLSLSFLIYLLIYLFNPPDTFSVTEHYIYLYTDHSKESITLFSSAVSHKFNSISCFTQGIVKYLKIQYMNTLILSLNFHISSK